MRFEITLSATIALALSLVTTGCSVGDATGDSSQKVVLDQRCVADADCPDAFECEIEEENGVETSFCVSHEGGADGDGSCPAGFEQEVEHGETFCKPHGGDGNDDGLGGSAPQGQTCTTDADCGAGLECEVEIEHGVTTSICKAHGGN